MKKSKKSKDLECIPAICSPASLGAIRFCILFIFPFEINNMTSLIQKIIPVFLRPTSKEPEAVQVMFEKNEDSLPLVNKIGSAKTDTTFDKLPRRAQMLLGLQKNWKFQKGYKSRFLGSKARKPLKVA